MFCNTEIHRKEMVSPSSRRRAVNQSVEEGLGSTVRACRALGMALSSYYRVGVVSAVRRKLQQRITALSREHPCYGYRRITALLRRAGQRINAKCVQRVRRAAGLQVHKRQRRMKHLGRSTAARQEVTHAGHVRSWDFVADQTEQGAKLRILTLLDEQTSESHATHVAWSIPATEVIKVVEAAMKRHGAPEHIRSDNGPEPERSGGSQPQAARRASAARQFITYAIQDWLKERNVRALYIEPGAPWENGHIERLTHYVRGSAPAFGSLSRHARLHDKLRDECLNREVFGSLKEAQIVIRLVLR
jgi:transposase InsO family protein